MPYKVFILIFSFLLNNNSLFSQKFGYVNTDFILNQMKEYQDALSEINSISKSWENEINDMYKLAEKKEISLKAEKILLTEEMYNEKRKIIDDEWSEIKNYQQKIFELEGLFFLKKKELIEPIQERIYQAVKQLSKDNNYNFILDKGNNSNILYADPKYDKSDAVLRKLNN